MQKIIFKDAYEINPLDLLHLLTNKMTLSNIKLHYFDIGSKYIESYAVTGIVRIMFVLRSRIWSDRSLLPPGQQHLLRGYPFQA